MKNQPSLQPKNQGSGNIHSPFLLQRSLNNFVNQKLHQHQTISNQFIKAKLQYYTPKYDKIKYFCRNHKKITATHYIMTGDSQKIAYCQKCAILIASQGFTVTKLNYKNLNIFQTVSSKQKAQKQFVQRMRQKALEQRQQLQKLEYSIQKNRQQIYLLTQQIKNVVDNINIKYQDKIQELQNVFLDVFQFLKAQKSRCFETLQNQFIQLKTPLQNFQKFFMISKDYLSNLQQKITTMKNRGQTRNIGQNIFQNIIKEYEVQLSVFMREKEKYKQSIQNQVRILSQCQFLKLSSFKQIALNIINRYFSSSSQNFIKNTLSNIKLQTVAKEFVVRTDPFSFGNQNVWTPTSSIQKKSTISPNDLNKSFLIELNNIEPTDIERSKKLESKDSYDQSIFKNIQQIQRKGKREQFKITQSLSSMR